MTFQPLIAVIHEVEATCWYGQGSRQKSSIQLQAIGEAFLPPVPSARLLLPGSQGLSAPPPPILAPPHRAPPASPSTQALPFLCLPSCHNCFPWGHMPSRDCLSGAPEGFLQNCPISAPAKCAQLVVSIRHKRPEDQDAEGLQKVLHFGYVAVGCTAERQIKLYNPSVVCTGQGKRVAGGERHDSGTPGLGALKIHPLFRIIQSLQ